MIGTISKFIGLRPLVSLAGAFVLGAALGAQGALVWRDAQALEAERDKSAALTLELGWLADAARAAVAGTAGMGRSVQLAAGAWANGVEDLLDREVRPIREENEGILQDVDTIEDDVADRLVPYSLCNAEARAYGLDPAVRCAALKPD